MKIREFFSGIFNTIRNGITRFITPVALLFALFIIMSVDIMSKKAFLDDFYLPFIFSAVFAIMLTIICERTRLKRFWGYFIPLAPLALYCVGIVFFRSALTSIYVKTAVVGLIFAMACVALYLLFDKENKETLLPYIVVQSFFAGVITLVICFGVNLCLLAFHELIYSFSYKVYNIANLFIFLVIGTALVLSYLPRRGHVTEVPRFFKLLSLYVALPLYLLLMLILYVYLIKVAFLRNLPSGEIHPFALSAAAVFAVIYFSVRQYENRAAVIFTRFGGYSLLPVFAMQATAIYQRVSAYGLTQQRYLSIIVAIVFLAFTVLTLLYKSEWIFLKIAAIALLVTLTPLNIIDVPIRNQAARIQSVMTKYGNDLSNISQEDKTVIREASMYIDSSGGRRPKIMESKQIAKYVYVYSDKAKPIQKFFDFNQKDLSVDISAYTSAKWVYYTKGGPSPSFDINKLLDSYKPFESQSSDAPSFYTIDENNILYIKNLSFSANPEGLYENYSIEGCLFSK
ncbi:MAG: DUF4153 domain-containing protein [Bacillota bacterium]|nr:DUF4153 domain-containing protein [Bacillota bacterium]